MSAVAVPSSVIVIGGGPAGYTFVDQLRLRGYRGELTLVDPRGLPMDRPPVSKEYLRGAMSREELRFREAEWYEERSIAVVAGAVLQLRPDLGEADVLLPSGQMQTLTADLLVLATGAAPIPAASNPAVPGIATLYNVDEADHWRSAFAPGLRLVVLGGGLVGAEAASAARDAGADVTLVNRSAPAGSRAFGEDAALRLLARHDERGVRVVTGESVEERAVDGGLEVVLADGTVLEADAVLDAGGALPSDELAVFPEEHVNVADDETGGVLADAAGRTSHPRVLAIGDVARRVAADGAVQPWRGHWESAIHSAEDAAAALLGQNPEERGTHWFWSDRHGEHIEVVGDPTVGAVVRREDPRGLRGVFTIGSSGELLGAVTFDDARLARASRRLIDRGAPVDAVALADPEVSARELVRPPK